MLVLNRRERQKVMIGNNVVVTIIGVKEENGKTVVKLGIDAPSHITIDREEVRENRLQRIRGAISDGKNKND